MTKRLGLLAALALALSLLAGCAGPRPDRADGREKITIALWSDQLTEEYGAYLQDLFPEVDFEFYVATNSTDFYRFKAERGDLPDILTVRRFSLNDVAGWKDQLMDLSDTELANTFHQSYLRSYTYSDGTVNWLPANAEVDGILLDEALLRAHDIPLPADYEQFAEACAALRAEGLRPFRSNFAADYTCLEVLQGLGVGQLTTQKGREWRQQYESGQTNQLSEEVWLPVFQRMEDFIRYTGLGPGDLEGDTEEMFEALRSGETAMIRGTSGEAVYYGAQDQAVMLPFFGELESWYLTYPAFQAAVKAEEDPEREALLLRVLAAMLDQDSLRRIAASRDTIAYQKGVEPELSPVLARMQPCLDGNRLYIRLASAEMFAVSQEVVQGMIRGEYPDARAAFDAFNAALAEEKAGGSAPAARLDAGYSYAFDPEGGSPAASAVMNTLREELGAQLLLGPAAAVAGDIAPGDYTEAELQYLTMGESVSILRCELTGRQLRDCLEYLLSTPGKRGSVINDSTLYVSSGFEMELRGTQEGYVLERLTIGGEALDPEAVYDTALLGNELLMLRDALAAAGAEDWTRSPTPYQQIVADRLLAPGGRLAAPTDYITLRR